MKILTKVFSAICACLMFATAFSFAGCSCKKKKVVPEEVVVPVPNQVGPTTYERYSKDGNGNYTEDDNGEYVMFGFYPQSKKESNITIGEVKSADGYYVGSDNERYVKAGFNYYKVEPLMWRIIDQENGKALLLCEQAIDQCCFNRYYKQYTDSEYYKTDSSGHFVTDKAGNKVYANNYEYSDLREFLTKTFLNTAFTDTQRTLIRTTEVDNSKGTTKNTEENKYACANTNDKVFALSFKDMTTYWDTGAHENDEARVKVPTAYAEARGVYKIGDANGCYWRMRSPVADRSSDDYGVSYDGGVYSGGVGYIHSGVVPALQISL